MSLYDGIDGTGFWYLSIRERGELIYDIYNFKNMLNMKIEHLSSTHIIMLSRHPFNYLVKALFGEYGYNPQKIDLIVHLISSLLLEKIKNAKLKVWSWGICLLYIIIDVGPFNATLTITSNKLECSFGMRQEDTGEITTIGDLKDLLGREPTLEDLLEELLDRINEYLRPDVKFAGQKV